MDTVFRFKKFDVSHASSSMKVGTDALLLGVFLPVENLGKNGLEIGVGSGVISLLVSSRMTTKHSILGIDIHSQSVQESSKNFENSAYSSSLKSERLDFFELDKIFDFIFSNPPYFSSDNPSSEDKRKVRHQYFSISAWAKQVFQNLSENGICAYVLPLNEVALWIESHYLEGFSLVHQIIFEGRLDKQRTILIFSKNYARFQLERIADWKTELAKHQLG